MQKAYAIFLAIAAVMSLYLLIKLPLIATSLPDGWHFTIFPPWFITFIVVFSASYLFAASYFLFQKSDGLVDKKFLLIHLLTFFPLLLASLFFEHVEYLVFSGYGWILYPVIIGSLAGQLLFLAYCLRSLLFNKKSFRNHA